MSSNPPSLDPFERRIHEAIQDRRARLERDLAEIVAVPSGQDHLPGLTRLHDWFTNRLRALGAEIESRPGRPRPGWLEIQAEADVGGPEADPDRPVPPTLVATSRVGDGADAVRSILCGHIDTVHPPHGPFQGMTSLDDDLATGPGVMDMKGGLIVALSALEILAEVGRPIDWTMVLVPDEETGTYHSEQTLTEAARGHDVGLVFEPALADGSLVVERMGSGTFMIESHGRAAHVGRAFTDGRSAVVALARAVVEVSTLADPERGRIVSVGPLHGGGVTNAVPHHARAWGNVRYPDATVQRELEQDMHAVVERLDAELRREDPDAASVGVRTSFIRPAKPRTPEVLDLAERARAVSEALDHPMPFAATGGACDGNLLQAAGVPTIDTLGVRGGGMHRPDEFIALSSLVERTTLLAVLLHRLDRDGFGGRPGSNRPVPTD